MGLCRFDLCFFSCFGGAPLKAFEAGDSCSRSLESCCCSAVLDGASSNGFVSSLKDSKGLRGYFLNRSFICPHRPCKSRIGCYGTPNQNRPLGFLGLRFCVFAVFFLRCFL